MTEQEEFEFRLRRERELAAQAQQQNFDPPKKPAPVESSLVKNIAGGAVRGAGSIGATLLTPLDAAARFFNDGKPVTINGYEILGMDRRAGMDAGLDSLGVDRNSLAFKGAKLGAEVAGTSGVGGVLGNVAGRFGLGAPVVQALTTGGMFAKGAGLPTRMAAGAVTGGAQAGLINPEDAKTGAMIGGALPGGVKLAGSLGQGVRSGAAHLLGMTTGTGSNSVSTAYKAGKTGATSFVDNMRGNVPMTDVIDSAKDALKSMRLERAAQYRRGMAGVSADKTVIDFAPIESAVNSIKSMGSYKGMVINKNSAGVVDEIDDMVRQWKSLDPAEFHTPEGLDALKQAIGDIRDTTQFGTAARKAADTAYNAVKSQITAQAPTYAKVMKSYSEATEILSEIERSLSLGNKAAADTALRKLQSLMRNNVNTNFGNRMSSASILEANGADIIPALAGQSMSSWTPRGLAGLAASGAGVASVFNPTALATLPFASPRLVGETAFKLGSASRIGGNAANAIRAKTQGLLGQTVGSSLTMDDLLPLLATVPVISAGQR